MRNKALALIITLVFLIVSSPCSHAPKKLPSPDPREEISSQKEIARSLSSPKEEPWWKKDENQFGLMVLIILGVALVASASIWIYFNTNGLTMNIRK